MNRKDIIPAEVVESKIRLVRQLKVMLDSDLAALYGVETKYLVKAVKRNLSRFPADFMFQLDKGEFENLRFYSGTSSHWGGRRYLPFVFTEQGETSGIQKKMKRIICPEPSNPDEPVWTTPFQSRRAIWNSL